MTAQWYANFPKYNICKRWLILFILVKLQHTYACTHFLFHKFYSCDCHRNWKITKKTENKLHLLCKIQSDFILSWKIHCWKCVCECRWNFGRRQEEFRHLYTQHYSKSKPKCVKWNVRFYKWLKILDFVSKNGWRERDESHRIVRSSVISLYCLSHAIQTIRHRWIHKYILLCRLCVT